MAHSNPHIGFRPTEIGARRSEASFGKTEKLFAENEKGEPQISADERGFRSAISSAKSAAYMISVTK